MHLLEVYGQEASSIFEDIFAKCLLCGSCNKVCPRGLDITGEVMSARANFGRFYGSHGHEKYVARKVLERPQLLHGARFFGNIAAKLFLDALPMESGLRLRLAMFDGDMETLLPTAGDKAEAGQSQVGLEVINYFPGCSTSYLYPKSIGAVRKLAEKTGFLLHIPAGLGCCGLALEAAGDFSKAKGCAKKNIEVLEQTEGKILVTCGSCWAQLKNYPGLFSNEPDWQRRAEEIAGRLEEVSRFFAAKISPQRIAGAEVTPKKELRVFYHDPCHLRNENQVTAEPRKLLSYIEGLTLLELEDGPQCCGSGGLFHLGAPKISGIIRDDLAEKVLAMKPDIITTTCSGCYMQWRTALAKTDSPARLLFLTELLSERLNLSSNIEC